MCSETCVKVSGLKYENNTCFIQENTKKKKLKISKFNIWLKGVVKATYVYMPNASNKSER